jgi:hypothetical protein
MKKSRKLVAAICTVAVVVGVTMTMAFGSGGGGLGMAPCHEYPLHGAC